jgi:hypothetical protein
MIWFYWPPSEASPGKRRKQEWVQYKGEKCLQCGYCKCIQALVFHHVNPALKLFSLSTGTDSSLNTSRGITGRTREEIYMELNKTVLLCNRCHSELHAGLWSIGDLVQRSLLAGAFIEAPSVSFSLN